MSKIFEKFKNITPFLILLLLAVVTRDEALQSVQNRPDVKKYLSKILTGRVEVDSESMEDWLIHVYEIKDGHTATMNWFTVDKKTGRIRKQFP